MPKVVLSGSVFCVCKSISPHSPAVSGSQKNIGEDTVFLTSPSPYLHKVTNPEVEDPGTLRVSSNPQSLGEPCGKTRRDKRREGVKRKKTKPERSARTAHAPRTILCPDGQPRFRSGYQRRMRALGLAPSRPRVRVRVRDPAGQRRRPRGGSGGCCGSAGCARGAAAAEAAAAALRRWRGCRPRAARPLGSARSLPSASRSPRRPAPIL